MAWTLPDHGTTSVTCLIQTPNPEQEEADQAVSQEHAAQALGGTSPDAQLSSVLRPLEKIGVLPLFLWGCAVGIMK
jgi:hypothetical protein